MGISTTTPTAADHRLQWCANPFSATIISQSSCQPALGPPCKPFVIIYDQVGPRRRACSWAPLRISSFRTTQHEKQVRTGARSYHDRHS
jgi:hypothetical protein